MSKSKKKYFIQQYRQESFLHGGVGVTDAETILANRGFDPVFFPGHNDFSLGAKLKRLVFLLNMFFRIKNARIVFLFPVYAKMNRLLIRLLSSKKSIKLICLIADINGLKDDDKKLLAAETRFFRQFRYFIVHNEAMKQWLNGQLGQDGVISTISFFDFLTAPLYVKREKTFEIVFAGNLEKSPFLENLHLLRGNNPSLHFHLYGPGITDAMTMQENVTYHGAERPYDLPAKLTGSFGLLWDGDSIDKPGGSLGHYMQYISHHKLSLYIISGLPIIVPASAASAHLIEKYNIGFAVNNLYEVEDKIRNISPALYQEMQINMLPLAEKISKGECLGNALDEILKLL